MTSEELIDLFPNPHKFYNEARGIYSTDKIITFGKESEYFHLLDKVGKMVLVDSYGGEGKGEEYWIVLYLENLNIYLRADGYYESYNGVSWDGSGWYEVTKQEKTITIYE